MVYFEDCGNVSRMFGFTYTLRGWYFPYVLRTRQEELAYFEDMYCRKDRESG